MAPWIDKALGERLEDWATAEFTTMETVDPQMLAQFVVAVLSEEGHEADMRIAVAKELSEFVEQGTSTSQRIVLSIIAFSNFHTTPLHFLKLNNAHIVHAS